MTPVVGRKQPLQQRWHTTRDRAAATYARWWHHG